MFQTSYAIALGSNRRHGRFGTPRQVIAAAAGAVARIGTPMRISRIVTTPALGPAGRAFANAVLILSTDLAPMDVLCRIKAIERGFGRRRGRRWGPRVLDLDIILWSGGRVTMKGLTVPHREFRRRRFVLEPLAEVAPHWRDPISGRTARQLLFQSNRRHVKGKRPRS